VGGVRPPAPPPLARVRSRKLGIAAAALIGGGLALTIFGAVLVATAYDQHSTASTRISTLAQYQDRLATAEQYRIGGGCVLFLGAGVVTAGAVLTGLVVQRDRRERRAAAFAPVLGGGGVGFAF
jgi:hypothetical protein